MITQYPCGWEYFICSTCKHYHGKLKCDLGYFIFAEGANISKCNSYIRKEKEK